MYYPTEKRENLEFRAKLLDRASKDPLFRAHVKELFHRDILFAFNCFYWTYDVRKRPHHNLPFITWEYEDEFILDLHEAIRTGSDRVVEKSRDMGVSWMVITVFHYNWCSPVGGGDFLLGSRIEDYVDRKGDMRTLFEKARYAHYHLPPWLWPKGFNRKKHDNYMKLVNPETGSTLTGESNNANFSTGGRYAGILFDEFSKWTQTDEAAWTAAGDATPFRCAVSTPFGVGGKYYNLVTDGITRKVTLHWSVHPEKALGISCIWPPPNENDKLILGKNWKPEEKLTSPWYEKECERRTATEVAQEIDINYLGAGNPVFDGKAGEALAMHLKMPDQPIAIYPIDLLKASVLSSQPIPSDAVEIRTERGHFLWLYEVPFSEASVHPDGRNTDPVHFSRDLYLLGVDVVEGVEGGDYAVVTVFNRKTRNVAAIHWSRIDEVLLSRIVKAISDFFSSPDESSLPMVGIETNGPGLVTFDRCCELGMTNLFMMPKYDVFSQSVSYKKGWVTSPTSKNELIGAVRNWLISREGKCNSHRLVGELLSFVRNPQGKPGAKAGCHDDMVMSFGITLALDELLSPPTESKAEVRLKENGSYPIPIDREELKVNEPTTLAERIEADALRVQAERVEILDSYFDY